MTPPAFQSHYGAIATYSLLGGEMIILDFQSHYGAIATVTASWRLIKRFAFQSHYGAIATCCVASVCH